MNKKLRIIVMSVIFFLVIYFIFKIDVIRDIVQLLLMSFVLAYALRPIERKLITLGLNKKVAAMVIIVGCIFLISVIFILLIPSIIKDGFTLNSSFQNIRKFIDAIYYKLEIINKNETMEFIINSIYERVNVSVSNLFNKAFDKIMNFGGNLLSYVTIPVIVYYFLSESERLLSKLLVLVPVRSRGVLRRIGNDIDKILCRYITSQFILCFLISILTLLVLIVLKVEYPFLLAILNGIFNIIPYFGPIFGSVPAILMALVTSPQKAIWVAVSLYVIQQIEGDIISPKITGDSVCIHPLVVILLLIVGGKLGGFVGMVLAIPIGVILKVICEDLNFYLF